MDFFPVAKAKDISPLIWMFLIITIFFHFIVPFLMGYWNLPISC